jgi:hypothetical protein
VKRKRKKWTPFQEATPLPNELTAMFPGEAPKKIMANNLYQVAIFEDPPVEGAPEMIHLSIKRLDKDCIRDWRHLQRIKNEIVGPENEAAELFPAESRLVDTANQFHLFVLKDPKLRFPFGFKNRCVMEGDNCGAKQRPFPKDTRPPDCTKMTDAEFLAYAQGVAQRKALEENEG